MNVADRLVKWAAAQPDAVAIIEAAKQGERVVTFGELDRRAAALSARLNNKGLKRGDRVLVMIGVSIDLYVALSALLRGGYVTEFLDPSAGRAHVRRCCEVAPPAALLGPWKAQLLRLWFGGLRRVRSVMYPPVFGRGVAEGGGDVVSCEAETPALLTFTSGSTASPKAAVRTHGLLSAQQSALEKAIDLRPSQVDLATLPVFVLANLAAGVTTVLADADLRRPGQVEPGPVLDQIKRHGVTRSAGSPAFYARLADHCEQTGQTLEPLEQVYTGGAPVFPDLLARLDRLMPGGRPVVVYGSTEAEPIAHYGFDEMDADDLAEMQAGRGLLVGAPVPEVELAVVDTDRLAGPSVSEAALASARCGVGEPGEVLVTGEHVLKGYVDPADDAETKVRVGDRVWHKTGDMATRDSEGRLWLLGRASAVMRDGRGTVYPFAIECGARQVEGVKLAAVAALNGRRLLTVELTGDAGEASVERELGERFAGVIDRVVVLAELPVDGRHNAKVRMPELLRRLEALGLAGDTTETTHAD
ncbi:MAG: AMP-binding protein [Planctomycetota bacterium]